ncbi:MAG TPA: hypothetical protein VK041_05330 [Opitutales bacterium]|nr:hypothetical protein [Opitutales bacterium]
MIRTQIANCAALFLVLATVGCGGDPEKRKELAAANDRIQMQLRNIETLEKDNERLRQNFTNLSESLKKTYEEEKGTIQEANRQRLAVLESEVAELRMQLSVSERQRLALQEAVDQPDRLKVLQDNNFAMERVVWIVTIFLCIISAVVLGLKYLGLRRSRRENIVRLVSELSHNPELNE